MVKLPNKEDKTISYNSCRC